MQRPLDIESPQDGMLRSLSAAAGEVVSPAAPLFEVMNVDPVWVKVPVYVGELPKIAADVPASISRLGEDLRTPGRVTQPISARC